MSTFLWGSVWKQYYANSVTQSLHCGRLIHFCASKFFLVTSDSIQNSIAVDCLNSNTFNS